MLYVSHICRFGRSRSYKVIDFGAFRHLIRDFPLLHHSNRLHFDLSATGVKSLEFGNEHLS